MSAGDESVSIFIDASALRPAQSGNTKIGDVTIFRGDEGVETVIAGEADDRLYDVVLDGARAWRAWPIDEHNDAECLVVEGTRLEIDPRSEVVGLPSNGDIIATTKGWALRCAYRGRSPFDNEVDALIVPAELAANRYKPKAYRRWRILLGAEVGMRVIFERENAKMSTQTARERL